MSATQGYKEIDRLEASLVSNEFLEPSGRAKAHKSIARLSSDSAPVWQNWIGEFSRSDGLGIDSLVPIGSLALRPALLVFGNLRPRVTTAPLPHATGAYGQLPGRDFNPLDLLLLLRTDATLLKNV